MSVSLSLCLRSRTSVWRRKTTRRRSRLKMLCCSGVRWRLQGESLMIYGSLILIVSPKFRLHFPWALSPPVPHPETNRKPLSFHHHPDPLNALVLTLQSRGVVGSFNPTRSWRAVISSSCPGIQTSTSTTSPPAGGTGWPSTLSSTNTGRNRHSYLPHRYQFLYIINKVQLGAFGCDVAQ